MRHFEFPVDREHAKTVNETITDARRLRVLALVVALLLVAAGVWLVLAAHPWSYILAAVAALGVVTAVWVAVAAPGRLSSVDRLYERGPLVAAVIAEPGPNRMVLLALVDVAKPAAPEARFALVARRVKQLPGHDPSVGERVPSVLIVADRSAHSPRALWQSVAPMPIAWGTRDPDVLAGAVAAIDEVEW
ncbi:MAG TPA: DUF3239 domain-containing protein, partial [Aldersonia sp.]